MTVRMASCRELSEDREAVSRLAKHFLDIEKNSTTASILLPWLPSSAKQAKKKATMALYTMLLSYVEARRKAPTPSMDSIDLFISEGISNNSIVGVNLPCDLGRLYTDTQVSIDHCGHCLCWSS